MQGYEVYETNIEYNLRFMVDTGLVGCQWVEIPPTTYRIREAAACTSHCQLEIDVGFDSFIAHPPEGEWAKVCKESSFPRLIFLRLFFLILLFWRLSGCPFSHLEF